MQGATRIICCRGGPHKPRDYEKGFMEKFVREQLWPALQQAKPKSFLYQAGALSKVHNFPSPSQMIIAPMMGIGPMVEDNDAVRKFIKNHPLESTKIIVTRPGALIKGN